MSYRKDYQKFLKDVKSIDDAQNAIYQMSDELANGIILSGKIIGTDIEKQIEEIGRKHGLLVLDNDLHVVYRQPNLKLV